jgi:hypothetical protein
MPKVADIFIWLAYLLCIASTLACMIHGLLNWEKDKEPDFTETEQK